jgi:CBS domain containing-hemolysin-like protein
MILLLALATTLTVCISAICSLLEAMILSTTDTDVDLIRHKHPQTAARVERIRQQLDTAISSILTLNTIANTLGAVVIGGLAATVFSGLALAAVPFAITLLILVFSEILPKNLGVVYRRSLLPLGSRVLVLISKIFRPITLVSNHLVSWFLRNKPQPTELQVEILALIDRGAKYGHLTGQEQNLLRNALAMDNVVLSEVMTPRTVVTTVDRDWNVQQTIKQHGTIPFARLPSYGENTDDIRGVVRRRDILQAAASGDGAKLLREMEQPAIFLPESSYLQDALDQLVESHQPLGVVVDEYGGFAGVVSMEDLLEFLIGKQFYEKDDPAENMRHLARRKAAKQKLPATDGPGS